MARPILTTQQTTDSATPENKSCRVFVSYSHKDSAAAQQFMDYFVLQLEGSPELAISPEQVFFDRKKLRAGDYWDESIQCALDQAEYFIFLVSIDSLKKSGYCYSRELNSATGRLMNQSLRIIQVILSPCPWENLQIPGDSQKRTLNKLDALPKDKKSSIKPVSDWIGKDRAHVWNEVVKQITEAMSAQSTQSEQFHTNETVTTTAATQQKFVPLLPYFCNQIAAVNEFNNRIDLWNNKALLVLTKGVYEDDLPNFWMRLYRKNLGDHLVLHNSQLLESRPFFWPFDKNEKMNAQKMMSVMMRALSDVLTTEKSDQLKDAAVLGHWLSTSPGVVTLMTDLPKEPKESTVAGIRVLLDLLERCSAEVPLNRLVIAMRLEDIDLIAEEDLYKTLKMSDYQRTHLVDLMPLRALDKDDIIRWYRGYEIEKLKCISEEVLLRDLADLLDQPLRMRKFANRINGNKEIS